MENDCIYLDEQWGFCYRNPNFREMCEYEPHCEKCPYYKTENNGE